MDKRALNLLNSKSKDEIREHLKLIQENNFESLLDIAVYAEVLGSVMVGCSTAPAGQSGYDCEDYNKVKWQFKKRGRNQNGYNAVDGIKEDDFDIIRLFLENKEGTTLEYFVDITKDQYFKYAKWRGGKQQMYSMNLSKKFLKEENLELRIVPPL